MRLEQEVNIYAKDAIKRKFLAAETSVSVMQGKISALISESEIQELQNSGITMYSKLGKLNIDVSGLTQQYSEMATKYESVAERYTALDSKLSEYKTSVDGLSANVSQVSTKLNNDYSTTEAMQAAIKAATDEISLSVSKTYVTMTTLSSTEESITKKAQDYASDAQTAAINSANTNTSNTLKSYSTTTEMQAAIKAATDEISLSVSKTYVTSEILSSTKSDLDKQAKNYASNAESLANANTDKLLKNYATSSDLNSAKDRVSTLESWKREASVKITDSAIVATVTKSTEWSNKADKSSIISQINMSTEGIAIKGSLIKLEGLVTANDYFKINTDGSMETTKAVIGAAKLGTDGSIKIGNILSINKTGVVDSTTSTGRCRISGSTISFGVKTPYATGWEFKSTSNDRLNINWTDGTNKDNIAAFQTGGTENSPYHFIVHQRAYFETYIKCKNIYADYINGKAPKSRIVETENYDWRKLYCYEMPTPLFGDVGEGILDDSGKCIIMLDDIFSETITTSIEYQVFLQEEGRGDIWVQEKNKNYFEVNGTAGLKFAWEIKAKQIEYEYDRLEVFSDTDLQEPKYEEQAAEMVNDFYENLEVAQ